MADDTETFGGLPKWPAAAIELPNEEPPAGPHYDGWLVVAAIAYPIIGFGILLYGGEWIGSAAFGLQVTLVTPLVMIAVVIGARLDGVRLRWLSIVAFIGWVLVVAQAQLQLWASVG